MRKYLNPEEPGYERGDPRDEQPRPHVKQMYCPRDGHYCEQPSCENCKFEEIPR